MTKIVQNTFKRVDFPHPLSPISVQNYLQGMQIEQSLKNRYILCLPISTKRIKTAKKHNKKVMQFEYKIKLKVNIKKQQKDDQNRAKYLQEGRFSTSIGSNKCPKLPARNANRTILKNLYILCLPISTKKNKKNQNLKLE